MENKISTTLNQEVLENIIQNLNSIEEQLPFLINMEEDQRRGGFRLGDKNMGFLSKTRDYMEQKPEFMPSYVAIDEVSKDTVLAEQLTTIHRKISILADKLDDTANIAGMEALTGALAYYNGVKMASKNNASGASTIYEDLKSRFPGSRNSNQTLNN
jgi:hypothetical protein